jgi:hypothetical protein
VTRTPVPLLVRLRLLLADVPDEETKSNEERLVAA